MVTIKMFIVYLLAVIICATHIPQISAQKPRFGACPTFRPFHPFDTQKFLGTWYEQARSFAIFELGLRCVKADYSINSDESIRVENQGIRKIFETSSNVVGRAVNDRPDRPAKLKVSFPGSPFPGDYEVVDTDYGTYAIVFGCLPVSLGPFGTLHTENLWILSRARNVDEVPLQKIYATIEEMGLDSSGLKLTDQTGCAN